ncbi:MAG: DUF2157 domain-containing protein [Candidatus Hydrogenedentota bacterium]
MSGRNLRWLYEELPKLVSNNILNDEDAERIKVHYGPVSQTSISSIALTLCSVLGATLIGSGLILLLAHNWEELSRPLRTIISFAPLVIGQMVAGWALFKNKTSRAWREGSGAFLALAIGSSISLIGQTYHIPGNLTNFLFTWMLLGLPVVYLLRSTTAAVFYLVGTTSWAISMQIQGGHTLWYIPLLLAILPFLWQALRSGADRPRTLLLGWVLCLNLCVSLGVVLEKMLPGLWIPAYASLFAIMILVGRIWYSDTRGQPYTIIGTLGSVILALIFTFDGFWRSVGYHYYRYGYDYHLAGAIQDYLIVVGLLSVVVVLGLRRFRDGDRTMFVWLALPLLAVLFFGLQNLAESDIVSEFAVLSFNLYLFALGALTMCAGVREGKLSTANGGMGVLALLFTFRFFDSDLGFVVRGVAFILIGSGFLFANVLMARRIRKLTGDVS